MRQPASSLTGRRYVRDPAVNASTSVSSSNPSTQTAAYRRPSALRARSRLVNRPRPTATPISESSTATDTLLPSDPAVTSVSSNPSSLSSVASSAVTGAGSLFRGRAEQSLRNSKKMDISSDGVGNEETRYFLDQSQSGDNHVVINPSTIDIESRPLKQGGTAHQHPPNRPSLLGGGLHSLSFLDKSSRSLMKEVSQEFDEFVWVLIVVGLVSIFLSFFALSGYGILTTTFVLLVCIASFAFTGWLVRWIMSFPKGSEEMQIIADYIKEGANGYLMVQYRSIAMIAVVTGVALFVIYLFRATNSGQHVSKFTLALMTSLSFFIGAFCSAIAGYTGVWTSVRVNVRVASAAAKYDFKNAFLLSFRGGAVSAILSASLCILGLSLLYIMSQLIFVRFMGLSEKEIPLLLGGYGFGASFVALFMQLGGGIYTKAADVGADMCGKIEKGIPEDDPRNPAVIADLVGDNVGDCAGSMADVFESIAGEMIGTMILGGTLAEKAGLPNPQLFVFFPLIIHALDLVVSSLGIMLTLPSGSRTEDPMVPMKRGYSVALAAAVVLFGFVCRFMLSCEAAPQAWWHFALCGLVGLFCAYVLVLLTQYYTDYQYSPVKKIAQSSDTGHGTNIIAGVAVGMESTAMPAIVICTSLYLSYTLGRSSGLEKNLTFDSSGLTENHNYNDHANDEALSEIAHMAGLFGTACATMGMLCTAVFVLSMNNFGPIADNAGGVVEMSDPSLLEVRAITDKLDAVGNVTKACTKGYAVGGSALACFLLFQAYLDEISLLVPSNVKMPGVSVVKVEIMIAGLLGMAMVFLFVGWAIDAVGRTAQEVVNEVRRQFREIPGIMEGSNKPDYATCVSIVTSSALKEMIRPAVLALCTPVVVGLLFKSIGQARNEPLLGVEATAAFLMFGTLTGLLMAIFLDNSGGAWDNAKKLIEATGKKGSEAHKAAVTGDTVGDPFKDTAGPALHVVITTMSTTALVLAPMFLSDIQ